MALMAEFCYSTQTYEPLGTVSVARAIIMTLRTASLSRNGTAIACFVRRMMNSQCRRNPPSHLH